MFKWFKRLLGSFLILCVVLALVFIFRAPLLRGMARAWIVNDPLTKVDAIVVLGGGVETRPFEAARLFQQGFAPKILLTNPQPSAPSQLNLVPTDTELTRGVLVKQGIPESSIFVAPEMVTNTFQESHAIWAWAKTNNVKSIIIPTDIFHTRRVRWMFHKQLAVAGIQVLMDAVPVREYTVEDWWQHEQGVVALQNELLKYAYYRLKY